MVLPAGTTYLGSSPTPTGWLPSLTPIPKFTADETVSFKQYFGAVYPFSFSYPETLTLVTFADNPPKDTIAIVWDNIPPQQNILLNIESIEDRDQSLVDKPKQEFVSTWWKYFSGLKGVASVTPFTNVNGLNGYKSVYLNFANESPNLDVFFEIPNRPDIMLHLANGSLDATIFNRIIDSLSWNTTTPTPNNR